MLHLRSWLESLGPSVSTTIAARVAQTSRQNINNAVKRGELVIHTWRDPRGGAPIRVIRLEDLRHFQARLRGRPRK